MCFLLYVDVWVLGEIQGVTSYGIQQSEVADLYNPVKKPPYIGRLSNHSLRLMKVILLVRRFARFVLTVIFIVLIVVGLFVAFSHINNTSSR